jgi:L-asparagine transporter-like permease
MVGSNKMRAGLKKYFVDTLAGFFWSWLILTPFAFVLWGFGFHQWVVWSWTSVPIWVIIGRPYVWLVMKTHNRVLKENER